MKNLTPTLSKGEGAIKMDVSNLPQDVYFVGVGSQVNMFIKE